ncbi:MAG: hypothetical protein HY774_27610 [Acidobacteria bacterium]|nr:hypothetical protein [Acidobacteriota bacterium]
MAPATLLATLIAEHILKLILSATSDFYGGKNFHLVVGEKTLSLSRDQRLGCFQSPVPMFVEKQELKVL